MRRLLVVLAVACLFSTALAYKEIAGAKGGPIKSPLGTVQLGVTITEHPTLPTFVTVTVVDKVPPGATYEMVAVGGPYPGTAATSGDGTIELATGESYRVHNGKHQWRKPGWPEGKWQDMVKAREGESTNPDSLGSST